MNSMFKECHELENLDLYNFNTNNVTDMGWMFNNCFKLNEIKGIINFNTINVKNMRCMFQGCKEIKFLDLSNFNTINVTDMSCMFKDCQKLKEIKGINYLNTINIIDMKDIFKGCNELIIIIIPKLNPSILIFNNTYQNLENGRTNSNNDFDKTIIAINFTSQPLDINFPIPCKITDNFKAIKEKLYDEYPQLKFKSICFLTNGTIINETETLENNGIKNGYSILINEY